MLIRRPTGKIQTSQSPENARNLVPDPAANGNDKTGFSHKSA